VELLERLREPLPELDALYCLQPEAHKVELLLQDFKVSGEPQHRGVHLAFTNQLAQELMAKLVENPRLAPRVQSLVEVPLSFVAIQDRGFHLDFHSELLSLFPTADPNVLDTAVHGLCDICRCLQATVPCIRYAQSDVCSAVAEGLQRTLATVVARDGASGDGSGASCDLLIVDRSIDLAATLIHEYTYEAMMYDVLDGDILDINRNVVRVEEKEDKAELLISDGDALWEELKHLHIEDVNHALDAKRQELTKRLDMRNGKSTEEMRKLLVEFRDDEERMRRMHMHQNLVGKLFQRLEVDQLMSVGPLEQDIACGIDQSGKDVKVAGLSEKLAKMLGELETMLPSEAKLRLVMLYLACIANVPETARNKLIEMAKLAPEDQDVLMTMLRTRLMEVPASQRHKLGTGTAHRVTRDQATQFKRRAKADGHRELSRFEPRLKLLLEHLVEGKLSEEEFPRLKRNDCNSSTGQHSGLRTAGTTRCAPPAGSLPIAPCTTDWTFAAWTNNGASGGGTDANGQTGKCQVTRRVVVFVLGGVTLSELRAAAEVTQQLPRSTEVLMGGTSVLTPRRFVQQLRPAAHQTLTIVDQGELDLT